MRFTTSQITLKHGRQGRRFLALLNLVALGSLTLLAFSASSAQAKDGQVTVRAAGITNASVTIKLSELPGSDINNRIYRLKNGSVTISGHSLLQVLRAADSQSDQIDLSTIPAIEVDRPGGQQVIRISGSDVRNPSAFRDGPPVFYEDNGSTVFVMPGSGSSPGSLSRFIFAPIGISIQTGGTYEVSLSASTERAKVGQKISFRATVTGQKAGEQLSFLWKFGDGSSLATARGSVTHTFRRDGSFPVFVDVSGASGAGETGILIEVGKVPKAKPEPKPAGNDIPQTEAGGSGGSGGSGGGSGGYGAGTGNGSGSSGSGAGGGSSAPPPSGSPPESKPKTSEPDDGLVEVQGQLVDPRTATPVAPAEVDSTQEVNPGPSAIQSGGFGVPGAALTAVGVGLLMGLGIFAELRIFSRLY